MVAGPSDTSAPEDVRDVRVVEGGEHLCLARESREPLGIGGERLRQDLQRDVALQSGVARAVDFPHTAGAHGTGDLVRAQTGAGNEPHEVRGLYLDVVQDRAVFPLP